MSEVSPRLYISGSQVARNFEWLRMHGITHIVNCANELPNYYPSNFYYMRLNMFDRSNEDIRHTLEPSKKFIDVALADPNNAVLVHCHMGMSRSATIVLYYLMGKIEGPKESVLDYALWQLRSKHSVANPNRGYMKQLQHTYTYDGRQV